MSEDAKAAVERRTDEAFARSAWQDPRGEYRDMLRRLRQQDAHAFDAAVQEYESRVAGRVADESVDPVDAWLDYGRRLADLLGGGRTVRIDAQGRAETIAPDASTEPALLLQMPADETAPAFVVAMPREPSRAQRATVALLAAGATALGD